MAEDAATRARRLLTILPFLRKQRAFPVAQLAAAVGVDERTLADDLSVLSLCGGDERDPGQLVGVMVEDGIAEVFADLPALERAVRLTPVEARALVAALGTLGVEPDSPLVGKLVQFASSAVDMDGIAATVRSSFENGRQGRVVAALTAAAEASVAARITYASWGSGEVSERIVHPYAIYRWRDSWYLLAYCERTDEERTFRIDRITEISLTKQPFTRPEGLSATASPLPELDELPHATVRFAFDAPDLTEREWPGSSFVHNADGTVTASIPYAGTGWIARRIAARLGDAEVLEPSALRTAVAATARSMLQGL